MSYLIKSVNGNMSSKYESEFFYPKRGFVEAKDWNNKKECMGGIYGIDENNYNYVIKGELYLIIKYNKKDGFVGFGDEIKIKKGNVVFTSKKINKIQAYLNKRDVIYRGFGSIQKGGNQSTLTGGYQSTLIGGNFSTLIGGYLSTLIGDDYSELTGGYQSTLTGGYQSTLIGGYQSTLIGGNFSTLIGGKYSTLTGGYQSTLIGCEYSALTGGKGSILIWNYFGNKANKRLHSIYIGEDGYKPNIKYKGFWNEGKNKFIVEEVRNENE